MKKLPYLLILITWIILGTIEMITPQLINKRFFFWRTWEYVINNDGLGTDIIPFKPLQNSTFISGGDLAHPLFFKDRINELNSLQFITDEYGFRNNPQLTSQTPKVILFGTSQVAGASETQDNLVASILNDKYKISSYTYAKAQLQQFWNEDRFKKNPPKYVVILGQDYEFTSKSYIGFLSNNNTNLIMNKWTDTKWDSQFSSRDNRLIHRDFVHTKDYAKRYSITRVISDKVFRNSINKIYNRSQLTDIFGEGSIIYDPKQNILFPNSDLENPAIGSEFKTKEDIARTTSILKTTQQILKSKGIILIVGVMPSKSYLYMDRYRNIPNNKAAITSLNQALNKQDIETIPIFEEINKESNLNNKTYYYPLDTHWNANANSLISKLINKKILEIEKSTNSIEAYPNL